MIKREIKLNKQNYSQYHIIAKIKSEIVLVLIDTGACNSYISPDLVEEIYESNEIRYQTDTGEEVVNNLIASIELVLSKDLIINLDLPIDNRSVLEKRKVSLGIDFLEKFDYKITSTELILDRIKIPRINLYYKDIESKIKHV